MDGMIEKYCKCPEGVRRDTNTPDHIASEMDFDAIGYKDVWLDWELSSTAWQPPKTLLYYLNKAGFTFWRRNNGVLGLASYHPDRAPVKHFYYHQLILSRSFRNLREFMLTTTTGALTRDNASWSISLAITTPHSPTENWRLSKNSLSNIQ